MNTPEIYLVEPYNAYAPKGKKKHWHQVVEEEALMARIIAEQQQLIQEAKSKTTPPQAPPESVPTIVGSSGGAGAAGSEGSAPGGGGTPVWDFWNPKGDVVNFDRSPSTGAGPLTVTFTNCTTTPQFDKYNWGFTLDGVIVTSTDVNPVIVFQTGSVNGAIITASLQATNSITNVPGGRSPDVYTIVNYPTVTAAFTYTTTSNVAPFSASFLNTSTTDNGQSLTYLWKFTYNDGTTTFLSSSTGDTAASRRIDSGSYTASLQATGSYNIASLYTQSFAAPAPTLGLSFTANVGTGVAPDLTTFAATVNYTGYGTTAGTWKFGEYQESGAEWTTPYTTPTGTSFTYETRSVTGQDGHFTASLQMTESIYNVMAYYTQSFNIARPTLAPTFTVTSASKVAPSLVNFTVVTNWLSSSTDPGTLAGTWHFGEYRENGTEWTTPYNGPTSTAFTYATRSDAAGVTIGHFTASLQMTESIYNVMALYTQSLYITASLPYTG